MGFFYTALSLPAAAENWAGVDEAVVKKIAAEHGREATKSLLNTDQGDLLLFLFLVAGTVGGFAAGYFWRSLMDKKVKNIELKNGDKNS
jgi:hypothetical protein